MSHFSFSLDLKTIEGLCDARLQVLQLANIRLAQNLIEQVGPEVCEYDTQTTSQQKRYRPFYPAKKVMVEDKTRGNYYEDDWVLNGVFDPALVDYEACPAAYDGRTQAGIGPAGDICENAT